VVRDWYQINSEDVARSLDFAMSWNGHWQGLGIVLKAQGNSATDCTATAQIRPTWSASWSIIYIDATQHDTYSYVKDLTWRETTILDWIHYRRMGQKPLWTIRHSIQANSEVSTTTIPVTCYTQENAIGITRGQWIFWRNFTICYSIVTSAIQHNICDSHTDYPVICSASNSPI
jgi:hypothetical protein